MRIGIDLGGTKIEAIALDTQGNTLFNKRVATPQDDYSGIIQSLCQLVKDAEEVCNTEGSVGIGTPGSLSPRTGLMRNSNTLCLNDQPFKTDLENALRRPIRIANDANCFTLSEAIDGAGKGAPSIFGVIIGTGTGGGLVINQQLLEGKNAIAGEWGHNPLPWPSAEESRGRKCYCGQHGCIETYLSGPGLCADYLLANGVELTSEAITTKAANGDPLAEAALNRYEDRMARSLASVINLFDPSVIVLGGGLSNLQRLYTNVPLKWGQYIFSDSIETRLTPPQHGDSSGVRGAAWLWPREE